MTEHTPAKTRGETPRPGRVLVVMPTWVGDAVMATPALRLLRDRLPGAFLGALLRPGIDQLLEGAGFFDEAHTDARSGVMGPKRAAARLRPLRYDTALLLTNSFSSALTTRIAGIPRRVGYERDGRSFLLTAGLVPPRRRDTPPFDQDPAHAGDWAPVPACVYYARLVAHILGDAAIDTAISALPPIRLACQPEHDERARDILARAGLAPDEPFALLNPGGNNTAKRWPAERFAMLARQLHERRGLRSVVSGAPQEDELTRSIASDAASHGAVAIADLGVTLSTLKPIVRRAAIMITNDTGPRHIAAAFNIPVVSLFGPTDHRWTTIPHDRERVILADPGLPEPLVANDHPERCSIDRIGLEDVLGAALTLLDEAPVSAHNH
ncbi:MAG: glycosyltransferase family 9 protein [Phycisphaeraceae bacterium]|nr:glycosyltransferase family 9 protein [Phycisphaeraceae bacterium]MCB9847094.1 glycosyltransferase family 9 protein [Phycisphaeraceae bacterium]